MKTTKEGLSTGRLAAATCIAFVGTLVTVLASSGSGHPVQAIVLSVVLAAVEIIGLATWWFIRGRKEQR